MKVPKLIIGSALILFGAISLVAWLKGSPTNPETPSEGLAAQVIEIHPGEAVKTFQQATLPAPTLPIVAQTKPAITQTQAAGVPTSQIKTASTTQTAPVNPNFPEIDRMNELFSTNGATLPIVKTITYAKKAPWLQNRVAWLVDYANHYKTSRYFISRSLAGKPDYLYQTYANGSRFNIFDPDKKFHFYILVDASRKKLVLYYIDDETNERVSLKTYAVGLGRLDSSRNTGMLTPLGRYSLGSKTAVYKAGDMGIFSNKKTEMIRIFGTRWIPFEHEITKCTAPAKGYGIHGTPWSEDPASQKLVDMRNGLSGNDSDGCLRMATEDINELFAIVTSRYTEIEIVNDFFTAELPGKESVIIR